MDETPPKLHSGFSLRSVKQGGETSSFNTPAPPFHLLRGARHKCVIGMGMLT